MPETQTLMGSVMVGGHKLSDQQIAVNQVKAWGRLRSGSVTIAGTDYMPPTAQELPELFDCLEGELAVIDDVYNKATLAFLRMVRAQFFMM